MGENCPGMYIYLLDSYNQICLLCCYVLRNSFIMLHNRIMRAQQFNHEPHDAKEVFFRYVYQRQLGKFFFFCHVYMISKRKVKVSDSKHIVLVMCLFDLISFHPFGYVKFQFSLPKFQVYWALAMTVLLQFHCQQEVKDGISIPFNFMDSVIL